MEIDGLRVVDATRPLSVGVEPIDCKRAKPRDPGECAAALAIIREYKADEVRVHLGRTYVRTGKTWRRYMTPPSVSREMTAFDRGASFEPGEYVFRPPSETARLGYRLKGGPKTRRRSSKPRPVIHMTTKVRQGMRT